MERYYQKGPESLENQGGIGPPTEKNGKVSARPATPNRETAAKGEKSVGLRRPRFPTTMLSLSWINLPNISISGRINPRSENIVQILVATFTLLALLPRSFYFQSIICDRLNLRLADPNVYDFPSPFYISFRC